MFNPEKISTNESSEDSTERNLGKLALQNDLAKAGNELAQRKHERFQNQRIQEQIERDLNQKFTTVDKLEEEVTAENPEILKYSVDYEGEEIPVYDLRGVPFSLLTHDIEYRRADKKFDEVSGFGLEQSRRLFQDPSLWMETEEEARKDENYNSERANMNVRGNVISMSYIDSGGSLNGGSWYAHDPHIIYGFSHLDGKRLRNVFDTDGGTFHYYDEDSEANSNEHTLRRFQSVISADYSSPYNEFLVDRYSETGQPLKPNYIVTRNGNITKDMMRHAKFFGIPILDINDEIYQSKQEAELMKKLDSIDDNSSYEEVYSALEAVNRTSKNRGNFDFREGIGDFYVARGSGIMARLGELEVKKRIDFIADELQRTIEGYDQATANGQPVYGNVTPRKIFCKVVDVHQDVVHDDNLERRNIAPREEGNCNYIVVWFEFDGKNRRSIIYDGERRKEPFRQYEVEHSDSSFYDRILPLVMEYYSAKQRNKEECF